MYEDHLEENVIKSILLHAYFLPKETISLLLHNIQFKDHIVLAN